jgi:hypothetical protein
MAKHDVATKQVREERRSDEANARPPAALALGGSQEGPECSASRGNPRSSARSARSSSQSISNSAKGVGLGA